MYTPASLTTESCFYSIDVGKDKFSGLGKVKVWDMESKNIEMVFLSSVI